MLSRLLSRGNRENDFAGKIVLVTGAASGLGRGIALAFAREGSDLVLVDIDEKGLVGTAAMVEDAGSRSLVKQVDVSNREEMENMAEEVLSDWGRVDILVNNAGVGVGGELDDIPLESVDWIVGINLLGEIYGTRLFLPQMIERGEGYIINVASLSGLVLFPLHIAYTTTKYGLTGFTEALWAETRHKGIGVSLVCPGAVSTNIMDHSRAYSSTERQKESEERWERLLTQRGMDPEEAGRRVLDAVSRKRFLVLLRPEAYLLYYLKRLFPGLLLRINAAISRYLSK
jgi:NAD(P)-dependent dehydrogenase (short-subunit alcohol dehydrogenase family)